MRSKPGLNRFAALMWLNFRLSLLICSFFILFYAGPPSGLAFAVLALVSNTAMLYAALCLAALPLYLLTRGWALPGALLALFQLFLVTDVVVYKIFKFHMNSMVLNLVLTPGGLESLDQGWGTKALFALAAAALAAAQWYFWRLSGRGSAGRPLKGRRPVLIAAVLLAAAIADKGLYAWGSLYDAPVITRNSRLFPFYQPLTVRKLASRRFGMKLDAEVKGGIDTRYSGLAYPAAPLEVGAPERPLNFLVLVIDSLRRDMLNPEVMPETWAFTRKAAVFNDHYSGGNCTRFGIFSALYGIYGNYWFPMLEERRGPVLLNVLAGQDYDLRAYASAKLTFPEFTKTCFVNVPRENLYDEPPGANGIERDEDISDRFISYLRSRDGKKPYFAFIFYDASHGNYDPLPGMEKFQPAFPVSQLTLNKDNVGGLFNRYKNSIYSDDHLAGRIFKAVAETGGLKDTVVLVLGDHGEAFLERGRFGHNQGYSPEEIQVPLVMYVPGRKPGPVTRRTSHLDIVPTLMRLAGVKNAAADFSSGRDLFTDADRPFVAAGSWDTAAIITADRILEMPLEAYRGGLKVFDAQYRELPKTEAAALSPLILQFQKEAGRFRK